MATVHLMPRMLWRHSLIGRLVKFFFFWSANRALRKRSWRRMHLMAPAYRPFSYLDVRFREECLECESDARLVSQSCESRWKQPPTSKNKRRLFNGGFHLRVCKIMVLPPLCFIENLILHLWYFLKDPAILSHIRGYNYTFPRYGARIIEGQWAASLRRTVA